jgi:hypothetical protein
MMKNIEDIDLDMKSVTADVYYEDGTSETIELPTVVFYDDDGHEDFDLDWDSIDPKLAEAISSTLDAWARVDVDDRAVRRAESGYCD